jgi:anti-sigma-K factor RskA
VSDGHDERHQNPPEDEQPTRRIEIETPHDPLGAYVLGALDDGERQAFELHLATCATCRDALAAYEGTTGLLAYGLPPQQPPAGARDRLLARARSEASVAPPVEIARRRGTRFRLASLGWAAALLFVIAVGLFVGAWNATGPHPSFEVAVLARLPGGRILPLHGTGVPTASAQLYVVESGRRAELTVSELPPLPQGQVYQLWFAEPDQPVRTGGVFEVGAGGDAAVPVTIPTPLERVRAVAVTREPAPGSVGPTGAHLLDWTP